jgi:hypothetical protein
MSKHELSNPPLPAGTRLPRSPSPSSSDNSEAAVIPQTTEPSKVERITAADIPFLSVDERRKWAERAIKERKVFEYVSGQLP